jgi:hypothetical protein
MNKYSIMFLYEYLSLYLRLGVMLHGPKVDWIKVLFTTDCLQIQNIAQNLKQVSYKIYTFLNDKFILSLSLFFS